mgnify:CR=1 FL=1
MEIRQLDVTKFSYYWHVLRLIQHLERHQPKTAEKVVAALDVNVPALTEPQILAAAREWFDDHKNG